MRITLLCCASLLTACTREEPVVLRAAPAAQQDRPNVQGGSRKLASDPPRLAFDCGAGDAEELPAGCMRGNGQLAKDVRLLGAFTRIRQEGPLDVRIKQGVSSQVAVELDENLSPFVTAQLDGDTLVLGWNGEGFVTDMRQPVLRVSTPRLRTIVSTGLGALWYRASRHDGPLELVSQGEADLHADVDGTISQLEVDASGPGEVELAGEAEQARYRARGGAVVRAERLDARAGEVVLGERGRVQARFRERVRVQATEDAGELELHGGAEVDGDALARGRVKRR